MTKLFAGDIVKYKNKQCVINSTDGHEARIKFPSGTLEWGYVKELKLIKSMYEKVYTHKNKKDYRAFKCDYSEMQKETIKLIHDLNKLKTLPNEMRKEILPNLRAKLKLNNHYVTNFSTNKFTSIIKAKQFINTKIREDRDNLKSDVLYYYYTNNHRINVINGFWDKEQLRFIASRKKLNKFFDNKMPTNDEKHIGVELEFLSKIDRERLALRLLEKGKAWLSDYINLGTDGSINTNNKYPYGIEARVLAEQSKIQQVIKEFCEALGDDVTVNSSCGLHVHLDMRTRDVHKSFWNLVTCQKLLFEMQPQSRRKNSYCTKTIGKNMTNGRASSRYKAINKNSWFERRTLEVRLHAGTTNYEKINNFISLLTRIADADKIERAPRTRNKLYETLQLPFGLRRYIETRIELFNNNSTSTENGLSTTLSQAA